MEERHSNLLRQYRPKFVQSVEVDRLYPMLVNTKVLSHTETNMLEMLPSPQDRVECLLDMLPNKGSMAFESLCLALETTYPHLLTIMFLGSSTTLQMAHEGSSQSTVSSGTSESDMEDAGGVPMMNHGETGLEEGDGSSDLASLDAEVHHHDRNYDELEEQHCTMQKVQALNKEYTEAVKRTEQAVKDAECFRNELHTANMSEHQLRGDLEEVKTELHQVIRERDCLQAEVEELRHIHKKDTEELDKLWRKNEEFMRQPNAPDMFEKIHDAALEKMDDLTTNLQTLGRRNEQLASDRNELVSKIESYEDEISALQLQIESMRTEKNSIKGQLSNYQQQYMKVMRDVKLAHKERDEALKKEQILKQKHTEIVTEYNQIRTRKNELEIKLRWTEDQRRAAVDEYSMVMGERDGVHKEMDKLQNDAQMEAEKRKEADHRIYMLEQELDVHKRRWQDSQQERDIALRDVDHLSERYRDMLNNTMMAEKERDIALKDFEKFKEQRDVARKERMEALAQRDHLLLKFYDAEQQQKTMSNERNMANRDVEQMRRQLDSLQRQLKEASEENKKAKQMRDWAFKERDKVVQERESIRTLSDQMRKERDLTVNKLAESLRKVDDMENQRNKSLRDLQEIRDKMQTQSEREARMRQLIAQHSRDSAIGADSLEWETENLEFDSSQLVNENVGIIGFDIAECPDQTFFPEDCSIYVTKVDKGSSAYGKLRVNDCLFRVNDIDLSSANRQGVLQAFTSIHGILHLVVKRRRAHACKLVPLTLDISRGNPLVLENGVFVSRLSSGSQSLRELGIVPGDRIVMVNNTPMENKPVHEVESLLEACQNPVSVTVMRLSVASTTSTIPSSASPTVESFRSQDESSYQSSLSALVSAGEQSDISSREENIQKEMSVQTESIPEKIHKVSREASFRSVHSREDSRESNATQGTLKAGDWEEIKMSQQYGSQKGPVDDHPSWDERNEFSSMSDSGNGDKFSNVQEKSFSGISSHKKNQLSVDESINERAKRANQLKHARDLQESSSSSTSHDTKWHHRRDFSFSGFSPDYSKTSKRKSSKKDSLEKIDYNSTWPKSRGPPDMLTSPKVKKNRDTHIHVMNPRIYMDPRQEVSVPPTPPSRKSSYHAPSKHHHSSSGSSIHSESRRSTSSQHSSGGMLSTQTKVTPVAAVRNGPNNGWSNQNAVYHHGNNGAAIATSSKVVPTRKWRGPGSPVNSPTSPKRPISMPSPIDPNYQFAKTLPKKTSYRDRRSEQLSYGSPGSYYRPTSLHFPSNSNPVSTDYVDLFSPNGPPSAPVQTHFVRDKHKIPSFVVLSRSMNSTSAIAGNTHSGYNTMPYSPSRGSRQGKMNSISSLPDPRRPSHQSDSSGDFVKRDSYSSLPQARDSDCGSISFPSNKPRRIHIPSYSTSSNSLEIAASSYTSGRSSPTSPSIPEIPSDSSHNGNVPETGVVVTTQGPGRQDDVRCIEIQKSNEQLGFAITEGAKEGIFVRSVTPNSLADEGKMRYGDQILEFNGVNFRQANKAQAASIMSRHWNKVNILVQYNPGKMNDQNDSLDSISHASTPSFGMTPNSPMTSTNRPQSDLISMDGTITPPTPRASRIYENLPNVDLLAEEVRRIYLKNINSSLGVMISGGNAVGIFVSDILPDSVAKHNGLRVGDQILEYNGVNLKAATAEQATVELQKQVEDIRLIVQYNITKYSRVQGLYGDAVYVRCLVDFVGKDDEQLSFNRDDILFINNTMHHHKLGTWDAQCVNEHGKTNRGGLIPSKTSLSRELHLRQSASEEKLEEGFRSSKKTALSNRRSSFFRRKKPHRSNSRESRDFSEGSISDVAIHDEIPTYQRVDRLDMRIKRPVVLLGPHSDKVASKLVEESPDKFKQVPESKRASVQDLDMDMAGNIFLDCQQPEGFYECIPTQPIKDICKGGSHCILDGVSPAICKRLNDASLFPIIVFIKFKSSKQIREQKDPHFLREKVNSKQAKDMFERAQQVEQEFRSVFTDTIVGGNLAAMCTRVKEVIDREQKKVMWVPSSLSL
ncbi:disks large homolog 5-like isoform X3 [Apostichopus japonicus]|uniref:disks large homolog 5-like isoform X3 n=1 Tax=Stichopus japonicus TaxID=307972 RepID=UPI003AB7AC24